LYDQMNKGIKSNCWESFFIYVLQQHDVLIEEQGQRSQPSICLGTRY